MYDVIVQAAEEAGWELASAPSLKMRFVKDGYKMLVKIEKKKFSYEIYKTGEGPTELEYEDTGSIASSVEELAEAFDI